jgi:hypothetical protein
MNMSDGTNGTHKIAPMKPIVSFGLCLALLSLRAPVIAHQTISSHLPRWTNETANQWYAKQPWLVGSNFIPSDAINELEMWQGNTFNAKEIDKELGWAQSIGMNTMRIFLHDLLWKQDSDGFKARVGTFLSLCAKHKIKPIFVLFDSVWDPNPQLGPQRAPRPGVHNSGWVQSPGAAALQDASQYPRLEAYVKGMVGAFAKDDRILAWDIWNEPDNANGSSYGASEPKNKIELVLALLPRAFDWARSASPVQPLTSGIWHEDKFPNSITPMGDQQLELSDIISFHSYEPAPKFQQEARWLRQYNRPIICTEYMARPQGSTFEAILPIAKREKIGAINWGFVKGRSQTNLPWDSWQRPYVDRQPPVWFHDIFEPNGKPYRAAETALIRSMTKK